MEYMLSVLVLCAFVGKGACEVCYTGIWSTTTCLYGCCGTMYEQYCCQFNLPLYVGVGVTCSIIFIAAMIGFFIFLCKKSTHPGRVVNTYPNTNVSAVSHFASSDGHYHTHTTMYPPPPGPGYSGAGSHPPPTMPHAPGYTSVDSKPPAYA